MLSSFPHSLSLAAILRKRNCNAPSEWLDVVSRAVKTMYDAAFRTEQEPNERHRALKQNKESAVGVVKEF